MRPIISIDATVGGIVVLGRDGVEASSNAPAANVSYCETQFHITV
jgi:hypothetical protein